MTSSFTIFGLIGCDDPSSSSSQTDPAHPTPRYIVYGDDNSLGAGSYVDQIETSKKIQIVNKSLAYDGTNGAMAFGQCQHIMRDDFNSGDHVYMFSGYLDERWYGDVGYDPDLGKSLKGYCGQAVEHVIAAGAEITFVMIPNVPDDVYASGPSQLLNGTLQGVQYWNSLLADSGAKTVTLDFTPDDSMFTGIWLNQTGQDALTQAILDKGMIK